MSKKILYIEDHEGSLFLVESLIEENGCSFFGARTFKEGFKIAKNEKPDLILMDLCLLDIDGYEAIRYLKEESALNPIPVVAMSAQTLGNEEKKCKKLGFSGFLKKPINVDNFREQLSQFVS